jgi:hypothetical protein
MNVALDEAIKEAYALAPAGVSHIHTIELRHASIEEPMYLVQGFLNRSLPLTLGGTPVVFQAVPFKFTLPKTDEGGLQELNVFIDNIGGKPGDFCELAMNFPTPVEIHYRPYISNDLTQPRMDPALRLFLTNVVISDAQIAARAAPADFLNLEFPTQDYTRTLFPALGNI